MTAPTTTAAAVVFIEPGAPEVLHVQQLPVVLPGPREVRLRVVGAGAHPTDLVLRSGTRPASGNPPHIPGMAVAGIVDVAGEESSWRPGDRVMGMTLPSSPHGGGYRASVVCPDDTLVAVPAEIDLHVAATLPMNGHTAMQVLDLLALDAGDTLVVTGAAGALGSLVVPLAASRGLCIVAVAREGDEQRVRELGAAEFVVRGGGVADRIRLVAGGPVDGVADLAVLDDEILPAVRNGGTLVSMRGWTGPADARVRVVPAAVPTQWHAGAQLATFLDPRYLTWGAQRFSPDDAPQAHRLLEAGGLRSGIVIAFD